MQTYLKMKELPPDERPYEKCLKYGVAALTDAELIAVLLKMGMKGERSVDQANRILNAMPDGLLNLITFDIDELMKIYGIGKVKAIQLKCIGEIGKRISTLNRSQKEILLNSDMVANHYMERLRHEKKELLLLAMFDNKGMLIADEVLTVGTSNQSLVSTSDIFRTALKYNAQYIILLHNHPSGNPNPSDADVKITNMVLEAGKLVGINLSDHIIIGDNRYYSFYQNNNVSKEN